MNRVTGTEAELARNFHGNVRGVPFFFGYPVVTNIFSLWRDDGRLPADITKR